MKYRIVTLFFLLIILSSCRLTKFVPDNEMLLNSVKIKNNKSRVSNKDLNNYIFQKPNIYTFGFMRIRLAIYSLSGRDTTKSFNKFLRKIGEPPVLLDTNLTNDSKFSLQQRLKDKGYLNSDVTSYYKTKKKKTNLYYVVHSKDLYKIRYLYFDINNDSATSILNKSFTVNSMENSAFDIDKLNSMRQDIVSVFRNKGYYNVQKDMFVFIADSTNLQHRVDIKLAIHENYRDSNVLSKIFTKKKIDRITIYCYENLYPSEISYDTVEFGAYTIIYNSKRKIFKPRFIVNKIFIEKNQYYNETMVDRTTLNFNSIPSIKYVTINFNDKSDDLLDCKIHLYPSEKYGYSLGLEANTNSGATVGVAANLGFTDKNLFHRGESFNIDGRVAYDLFRKSQEVYKHSITAGINMSLIVPKLLVPYLNEKTRFMNGALTKFSMNYTYQKHPDFSRSVANTTIGYQWHRKKSYFALDIADLSYIKVDSISPNFLQNNPNLRPTFEDHLVLKTVFSYSITNRQSNYNDFFSFRSRISTGGNLFYAINAIYHKKPSDGQYKVFKTPFSQFVKGDFDFSYNFFISNKFRFIYHTSMGIGFPYGNASILPFEERFFAGGANSMRGWDARTLGPGTFFSIQNSYLTQNGDIKLEMNIEARFKLFWVLEGAIFFDAGNIWTIKPYHDQIGGEFSFKNGKFINEIALNSGIGLRFDFNIFLIRFDMGIKLYDPRYDNMSQRWIFGKNYYENQTNRIDNIVAFQFAIGYPF